MRKQIILSAAIALVLAMPMTAQTVVETESVTSVSTSEYVDLFFNGFTMQIPQGLPVNMEGNNATMKNPDGSFGLSLDIEKNKDARPQGAYEITQRLVTDLHIQGAKLSKVKVNGMEGAVLEGKIEGANVAVEVLDAGKKYVKLVAIYTDARAADAKKALLSIRK